jgi:hypothetical protein
VTSPDGLERYAVTKRHFYLAPEVDALIAKLREMYVLEGRKSMVLLEELTAERARAEAFAKYVPNFAQNRYFNTDGQYAYERTIGEVRARFDEVCEGEHFTVVKPDSDLGYVICIGGIQPREHVIELLKERLAREYVDYLSATEGKGDAALAPTAETGKAE